MADMDKLLEATITNGGSDLHIRVGVPPMLRIRGRLRRLNMPDLTSEDTMALMKSVTSERHQEELAAVGGADFALAYKDLARFRVSIFRGQGNVGMVLRQIPNKMLSMSQVGLPENVPELCMRPRGMFLVTGPTGSGKTTTLTSMIDFVNSERNDHIITIEDPIEFVHKHKKCVVTQREIGADVPSFAEALRRALRQDPDIILVGEMRDLDTISAAITAAETGHFVFGTLHTTSAAKTIDRIIDAFPTTQQEQVRTQLATALVAVLCQQLLPTRDGKGRVAAFELMINTSAISNLIREKETFKIDSIIQTSGRLGMTLLDDHLFDLFAADKIKAEDAIERSNNKDGLRNKINNFLDDLERQQAKKR